MGNEGEDKIGGGLKVTRESFWFAGGGRWT